jgi:Armadillo/beta-catenin-like repeat
VHPASCSPSSHSAAPSCVQPLQGNQSQIQRVLESHVIPTILHCAANDELSVAKEATWVITNYMSGGTPSQLTAMVQSSPTFFDDFATALERLLNSGPIQVCYSSDPLEVKKQRKISSGSASWK